MSIDINWETATSGADGEALAERIRAFIHEKFQEVTLPRFIRSVHVHSFTFGKTPPDLEIKDICDPFADFYEEDEGDDDDDDYDDEEDDISSVNSEHFPPPESQIPWRTSGQIDRKTRKFSDSGTQSPHNALRTPFGLADQLNSPFLSVTGTSGIPGGTANLGYHFVALGGLSGTQTPLAAVATGGSAFSNAWSESVKHSRRGSVSRVPGGGGDWRQTSNTRAENNGSPSRPSTANTVPSRYSVNSSHSDSTLGLSDHNFTVRPDSAHFQDSDTTSREQHSHHYHHQHQQEQQQSPPLLAPPLDIMEDSTKLTSSPHRMRERKPDDFQVICRVKYESDMTLSLTAEILLDYPMPSFVGLPLKLNITGLSFDGVAVLAFIRKRAHFCFLSPEDADALLGDAGNVDGTHENDGVASASSARLSVNSTAGPEGESSTTPNSFQKRNEGGDVDDSISGNKNSTRPRFGSLLQKIRVDSEIGRKENGKQVLKNVGKVERFVLDRVRRIFEEEFVYPSFWTFLI
jgi:mitochondrial distribution and morphology protein 12